MEEAINNLLLSIKSGVYDPNCIDAINLAMISENCTLEMKRLDTKRCFGCNSTLDRSSIKLPRCPHRVCSISCLNADIQLQGKDRAKCRHCLQPIRIQEIPPADLQIIEPIISEKPKFTCNICTDEFLVENSITLTCDHRFCMDCITGYVENLLEEGKVESSQVKCPLHNCMTEITYNEARALLRPELFERLDMLMTDRLLPTLENERFVQCSNTQCLNRYLVDKTAKTYTCFNCGGVYCAQCNKREHPNMTCEEFSLSSAEELELMKLASQNGWKKCPVCRNIIEKNEGCRFMACKSQSCQGNTFFCWECDKVLKERHEKHVCKNGEIAKARCSLF